MDVVLEGGEDARALFVKVLVAHVPIGGGGVRAAHGAFADHAAGLGLYVGWKTRRAEERSCGVPRCRTSGPPVRTLVGDLLQNEVGCLRGPRHRGVVHFLDGR